jgi:hypothetical protein
VYRPSADLVKQSSLQLRVVECEWVGGREKKS